jgi:outer membrane protein OmpA-like peptidoglycan-associated protein
MRHIIAASVGALSLAVTLCATSYAQEQSYLQQHVAAPSDALELKVGTGYTQGFGSIAPSRSLDNAAGAGLGVSADVDYRLSIPWSIGIEGQYQEFENAQNSSARGLAVNLGGTYHFDPVLRGDPWLRLGAGYRLFWENSPVGQPGVSVLRHGFDLLTAKVGYDVRVSQDVALGPVVGADLNVFAWQDSSNTGNQALSSVQVGTFIYAGLQGRFDVGGTRSDNTARPTMGVTAPQPETPIAPPPPPEPVHPVSPSINVSEEILRRCSMEINNVNDAPKFDFNKSDLTPQDLAVLQQIADCFATGPMKDDPMRLVGRADPRGTVAYNDRLGMRRADSVASFLEGHGIDAGRVDRVSRGKRDARGRDEATWLIDRRVDILVAR